MITSDYGRGERGQEGPKYDYIIFECSLSWIGYLDLWNMIT